MVESFSDHDERTRTTMALINDPRRVDDMDRTTPAVRQRVVGVDGRFFQLDLSQENSDALDAALAPYLDAGRQVRDELGDYDASQVRAWAREKGYQIGDRGKISRKIIEEFLSTRGQGA